MCQNVDQQDIAGDDSLLKEKAFSANATKMYLLKVLVFAPQIAAKDSRSTSFWERWLHFICLISIIFNIPSFIAFFVNNDEIQLDRTTKVININ